MIGEEYGVGRHIYIEIRHKVLKSSRVVMGTNFKKMFTDKRGQ